VTDSNNCLGERSSLAKADAAKNCHAKPEDIDKQITMMENKKEALSKQYNENVDELEHVLNKLHSIKAESIKCSMANK